MVSLVMVYCRPLEGAALVLNPAAFALGKYYLMQPLQDVYMLLNNDTGIVQKIKRNNERRTGEDRLRTLCMQQLFACAVVEQVVVCIVSVVAMELQLRVGN